MMLPDGAMNAPLLSDEHLQRYLDGTLAPHERAAVEARLQREPEARAALAAYRALYAALAEAPPVVFPEGFAERVARRVGAPLAGDVMPERLPLAGWLLLALFAALCLGAVAAALTWLGAEAVLAPALVWARPMGGLLVVALVLALAVQLADGLLLRRRLGLA